MSKLIVCRRRMLRSPPRPSGLSSVFFSSRKRHTRCLMDWSSDVCSSDLVPSHRLGGAGPVDEMERARLRRASRQIWRRRSFGPTAERVFDHAAQIAFELAGNIKMRAHRVEVFPVKRLHVLNGVAV